MFGIFQVKGKAAIDVVCNPLGKSGGALIQQFMILTFGSLANSTPYLGGILLMIVLAWLGAARSLDLQFSVLAKEDLQREIVENAESKDAEDRSSKGNGFFSNKEQTVENNNGNGSTRGGSSDENLDLPTSLDSDPEKPSTPLAQ